MPEKTDQKKLLENYELEFISKGSTDKGWIGQYYLCPICRYYVDRTKYDECDCGNISIDVDYCRISVEKCKESEIEVYNANKNTKNR